ncbi:RagB/SusD family nutrient uptake outer membrane protein [Dyadobacter fermentans]|uniref:RagB/SusD domain protein n=1 Tax=Dyadobacter fermentans (strain ATCC 700827 / DSM 18053 / CIP 107007 / KCTC 52180 / NS114) TaxID=471854 RepID=C6VUP2_DYAFD|nr:RagB/SusD family nutrient uptake outer membrane protein [Dyadobacter fermentans]ACT93029.1 RagB/SusD domain protein [Dyadobacter fermentans DSM 18053]
MKKILLFTVMLLQFSACKNEEFFELERPVQSPWTKLSEFDRAVIGPYALLFAKGDWGNVYNYWYLYKNAVADDVAWSTPGDGTWGWYRDTEANKAWTDDIFNTSYNAISSVNDALQFVDDAGGAPFPKITADDQKHNLERIVGELHFLRGFAYYMAATTFCTAYVPGGPNNAREIPLRTTKATSYEDASTPKIGTTQEIWDQVLADFDKAYQMLPERFVAGKMHASYQAGRANKFAAAAMLARAHFAMGNYPKALEFASFVIDKNGGDYDLSEEPIEAFNKSMLARGKETIMYIPSYDLTYGKQNLHATCFSNMFQKTVCGWTATHMDYETLKRLGWMQNPKSDTTIGIAAKRDKRFTQLCFVREPANVPQALRLPNRYYETRVNLTWRTIVSDKSARGPEAGYTNVPQIRLAEMYLTRASCAFKAGDKKQAAADLNIVRKRAWNAAVAKVAYESSPNFVTESNVTEQMIGDERLIEMFCEGDRIDYLRAMKKEVGNGDRGAGATPYTSKAFVWPVPVVERSLNNGYQ